MRCKKCGFNLLPGMTVCPACDTAVEGNQGSASKPQAGSKTSMQSGDNVISKEVINRVRNSCLRIHSAFAAIMQCCTDLRFSPVLPPDFSLLFRFSVPNR